MTETTYTLARWQVTPGREADFLDAWKALGTVFRALPRPPAGEGLLLQSTTEPTLHYSFGPWADEGDVAAMRADPGAHAAIERVIACCDDAAPGDYRVVARA